MLAAYRKMIVLFADESKLSGAERAQANQLGQSLFHENQQRISALEAQLGEWVSSNLGVIGADG